MVTRHVFAHKILKSCSLYFSPSCSSGSTALSLFSPPLCLKQSGLKFVGCCGRRGLCAEVEGSFSLHSTSYFIDVTVHPLRGKGYIWQFIVVNSFRCNCWLSAVSRLCDFWEFGRDLLETHLPTSSGRIKWRAFKALFGPLRLKKIQFTICLFVMS